MEVCGKGEVEWKCVGKERWKGDVWDRRGRREMCGKGKVEGRCVGKERSNGGVWEKGLGGWSWPGFQSPANNETIF